MNKQNMRITSYGVKPLGLAMVLAATAPVFADQANFRINQQPLKSAIALFAEQAKVNLIAERDVDTSILVSAVTGEMNSETALHKMLNGTNLKISERSDGMYVIARDSDAGAASGQEKVLDSRNNKQIEEMVVTAQKQERSIKDVPISIIALGSEELEQRKISDFNDLAMAVPGLSVMDWGHIGQRRIYLRGLASTVGEALVGVYLDETPTVGSSVLQIDYRTYDLERVEILKGPQGTLFGQGSVGGTIRFITKDPNLQEFGGRADVSTSFTTGGSPSQDVKGVVNIPLVENRLALRVAGVFENNGGWVDQPAASVEDINDSQATYVRAKLLWEPTDNLEVTGTYSLLRKDAGLSSTDGFEENTDNQVFEQAFGRLDHPTSSQDYDLYNLTIKYNFGAFSVVNSTNYIDIEHATYNLSNANNWDFGWVWFQHYTPLVGEIFSNELRFSSNSGSRLQWTVGGVVNEVERATGYDTSYGPYRGEVQGTWVYNIPLVNYGKNESWAVFGEAGYAITDNLEMGLGLRYFEEDKHEDPSNDETFSATSPRFYVRYDVTNDMNLYASAGKGFRSGGFNNAALPEYSNYDPETTWSYELGSKGYLLDGAVNYDVALFFSRMDGFQIVSTVPGTPFNALLNGGIGESKGVDWNIEWKVSDRFTLGTHGTVTDPTLVESDFEGQPFNVGDTLPMVPKVQFGFTADYDFDLAGRPGVFSLDYNRKGKVEWRNRVGYFAFTGESDVIEMLNANMTWDWTDTVTLGVFARNLLNETGSFDPFRNVVFGSGYDESSFTSALPPRPRTFGFSLGVEF